MSSLRGRNRLAFEKLFGMSSGYVLNFSNREFDEFIVGCVNKNIYDGDCYESYGTSKANRLREFWDKEPNHIVGKLMVEMLEYSADLTDIDSSSSLYNSCMATAQELSDSQQEIELDAINEVTGKEDVDTLAKSIHELIDSGRPQEALDRLHTYTLKFLRDICSKTGIDTSKEIPLHSLMGAYVKLLKREDLIETEMSIHILKSSISILEAFNHVRNNKSLAHDNNLLSYSESIFICKNVLSTIGFVRELKSKKDTQVVSKDDDLPF